jgi:hypothetical protein
MHFIIFLFQKLFFLIADLINERHNQIGLVIALNNFIIILFPNFPEAICFEKEFRFHPPRFEIWAWDFLHHHH